jgi:hypothetical protein
MKWNNFTHTFDDGVKKVYKDKTGNIAEINLMLTALGMVPFNAKSVSTRSNGIAFFLIEQVSIM